MRRILLVWLLILWVPLQAQKRFLDNSKDFNFMSNYRHWGITLGGNLYPFEKHTDPVTGQLTNRYYLMWGFDLGLAYHIRLNNYLGIKLRLTAERAPVYSYLFYVPGNERADGRDYYTRVPGKYAPFSFHLPVGFEVRTFAVPLYIFLFRAGLDVGYVLPPLSLRDYGDHLHVGLAGVPSWQFSPYVAAGWYFRFPWFLWETDIVYRFDLGQPYYQGLYTVDGLQNTPAFGGTITQNGNYIGLQFTWYPFHRNRSGGAECPGKVHSRAIIKQQRLQQKARERAERINERERKRALKHQRRKKKRFILF